MMHALRPILLVVVLMSATVLCQASEPSAKPSTAPAATSPTTAPAGALQVVQDFFNALRRQDLNAAKQFVWVAPGGLGRDFDREMPSTSRQMADGKRDVAALDAKEGEHLAIVLFNEDVSADGKISLGNLEPLWLVKQNGLWKISVSPFSRLRDSLTDTQREEIVPLRHWFRDCKSRIAAETDNGN